MLRKYSFLIKLPAALDSAYKRARRLHRDVSIDNIILYRQPGSARRMGLLSDWEFSTVADSSGKATDNLRIVSILSLFPDIGIHRA